MSDVKDNNLAGMYGRRELSSSEMIAVEEATKPPRKWSFAKLVNAFTTLAMINDRKNINYIPLHNRPDVLELTPLSQTMDKLRNYTKKESMETGMAYFIDPLKGEIVPGDQSFGTEKSVRLDWTWPYGKINLKRCFSIHTHPGDEKNFAHGFSEGDYEDFIREKSEMMKIIIWGDWTLVVLKTSGTPNTMDVGRIKERVDQISREVFVDPKETVKSLVEFNKLVCLEFGLTLYIAKPKDNYVAKRVNVTS